MKGNEVERELRKHEGRRVRITCDDGWTAAVDIRSVDDEGVLHSGPDGEEPAHYWTRFASITRVEPLEPYSN